MHSLRNAQLRLAQPCTTCTTGTARQKQEARPLRDDGRARSQDGVV